MQANETSTTDRSVERLRAIRSLTFDLSRELELVELAAEGLASIGRDCAISERRFEAFSDLLFRACCLAERIAALAQDRPCEWNADAPPEEKALIGGDAR